MFSALRHPNFRSFLAAHACAMSGHWVQQVALGWLVFRLTDSALYLGLVGTCALLPNLLLTPFVGVFAETADRRRILLATQSAAFAHALLLAVAVVTEQVGVALLLALALAQGAIQGFDWTNRQSLLAQLVDDRADLPNAIALNSTSFNVSRILGPALAGALLMAWGEAACFVAAALLEAVAFMFTKRLRLARRVSSTPARAPMFAELGAGARYAWRERAIRRPLLLVALAGATIVPYVNLLPVFATRVFGGGPDLLGALNAAPAIGAVIGGLLLASQRGASGLERRIFIAGLVTAAAAAGFALAPNLVVALPVLALLGGAQLTWMASMNTRLQTVVHDSMRARVMSFFNMAFLAALPFGQLIYGAAADHVGVAVVMTSGAGVCLAGHLWLHFRVQPKAQSPRVEVSNEQCALGN
ncbi:MFS transporter [Opitutales bacterium ASA1]|uniref:MFS transporter n=1 Tax=Congregicoccus parvus TaxID=3081749 RepID=UPI002B29D0F7|nr:MFS transporter [Opitutales bacterium ASA1]